MTPQNPFDTSASLLGGAADVYKTIGTEGSLGNINKYINPYYEQVLDRVLGRMDTNQQLTEGRIGDAALSAGAFGGSRHGVAEGVSRGEYNKNVGDVTADLMSRGWEDAAGRSTSDMLLSAQGQTQLGNNFYQIGNDITDRQMQQGTMQQQLLQAILSGGANQFDQFMQNPYQMIDMFSAILGGDARRGNVQTQGTSTPGLFDYVSLGAQLGGGA